MRDSGAAAPLPSRVRTDACGIPNIDSPSGLSLRHNTGNETPGRS